MSNYGADLLIDPTGDQAPLFPFVFPGWLL